MFNIFLAFFLAACGWFLYNSHVVPAWCEGYDTYTTSQGWQVVIAALMAVISLCGMFYYCI